MPNIWGHGGRLWAEEGTIFFQNALDLDWGKALFYSYGGYLNLPVNAATLGARYLMPLPYAPYFTMLTGLLCQLTPFIVLLIAKDKFLATTKQKIIAIILVLLVPESSEISVQSLHIQFSLGLATALILCLKIPNTPKVKIFSGLVLLLGPLSGPASIIFSPLFCFKALLNRNKKDLWQSIIISLSTVIQLLFFYQFHTQGRSYQLDWRTLPVAIWARIMNRMLNPFPDILTIMLKHSHHTQTLLIILLMTIGTLGFITFLFRNIANNKNRVAFWLTVSALLSLIISIVGQYETSPLKYWATIANGRYFFIPGGLLCLAIFSISQECYNFKTSITFKKHSITVTGLATSLMLLCGIINFNESSWIERGIHWKRQAKAIELHKSNTIEVYPRWWHHNRYIYFTKDRMATTISSTKDHEGSAS